MSAKKPEQKPTWYGSPHKRSPELYYKMIWVDKETYQTVELFAKWNKISVKSAGHQLLKFGLTYYAIAQLRLEQARQTNEKKPTPAKVYSLAYVGRILNDIRKKRKELPQIPGQKDGPPF